MITRETSMKNWLLMMGLVVATGFMAEHAAQNYPWCGYYKEDVNCGFTTYEQCMATVRDSGGYCARNTQYPRHGGWGLAIPAVIGKLVPNHDAALLL